MGGGDPCSQSSDCEKNITFANDDIPICYLVYVRHPGFFPNQISRFSEWQSSNRFERTFSMEFILAFGLKNLFTGFFGNNMLSGQLFSNREFGIIAFGQLFRKRFQQSPSRSIIPREVSAWWVLGQFAKGDFGHDGLRTTFPKMENSGARATFFFLFFFLQIKKTLHQLWIREMKCVGKPCLHAIYMLCDIRRPTANGVRRRL